MLNEKPLKLAPLLAQYLYSNKRLDLPGIGSFTLDSSYHVEPGRPLDPQSIGFVSNASVKEEPELIQFISSQTGKMKALAAADLDSYLQLALQFLNIGKPFLVEGIGSLVKVKSGFAFAPGELVPEKIKEYSARELLATSSAEESFSKETAVPVNWKKPALVLLIIAGLGLAIWGGYTMYKNSRNNNQEEPIVEDANSRATVITDSTTLQQDSNKLPPGTYKFIIEVSPRDRILQRLTTLQGYGLNVKMEPQDSINYKLYFTIPATPRDTARIRDSLGLLYTPAWSRAFVEQ
jgi:hypothetical protein